MTTPLIIPELKVRCPTLAELPPPPPGKTGWPWTEESPQLPDTMPNGQPWPRLSVVTPSYNQGCFLEEAIRSVLLQGYPDIEFVIIDGGSDDESVDILRRYEPWLAYWVSEPDRGQSHALNKGIARTTGKLLFWLNADDLCLAGAFGIGAEAFNHPSNPRLVVGAAHTVNEASEIIGGPDIPGFTSWSDYALRRCMIRQLTTFFDRSLFDELGGVDERLRYCMDRDLLLRFTRSHTPLIIKDFVSIYRNHSAAKTQDYRNWTEALLESERMSLSHLQGTPWCSKYLADRSRTWLAMAGRRELSLKDKLTYLMQAIRLGAMLWRSKEAWHKIYTMLTGNIHRIWRFISRRPNFIRSARRFKALEEELLEQEGELFSLPFIYSGYGEFASIRPKQVIAEIRFLYELIRAEKPRRICEIGTFRGGTFYLWCQAARDNAVLIAIDLPGNSSLQAAFSTPRIKFYQQQFAKSETQQLHFIAADSHRQDTADQVAAILGPNRLGFLFIDGDHSYAGVKQDFELYKSLVRPGGIIAFHDILPRPDHPTIEVYRLWAELKSSYRHREIIAQDGPYANLTGIGVIWLDSDV